MVGNIFIGSAVLGVVFFLAWVLLLGFRVSLLFPETTDKTARIFFSGIALFSLIVIAGLAVYFIEATPWIMAIAVATITYAIQKIRNGAVHRHAPPSARDGNLQYLLEENQQPLLCSNKIPAFIAICQILIFVFLVIARTSEPLISPWNLLPGSIFVLFFLSSFLLLREQYHDNRPLIILSILQTFLAVSVSAIVYGIGFGFDPFIHRAAETALVVNGHIAPLRLLYSGQYALVGFLHFLTSLSVRTIDIWLVPIFASIFLPLASYIGLRDGWRIPERFARLGWATALFIPFMLSTFTAPFTFTYTIFIGILFLFPLVKEFSRVAIIVWMLVIVAIFFHPLLSVPMLFLLAGTSLQNEKLSRTLRVTGYLIIVLGVALVVPLLLYFYEQNTGVSISLASLLENVNSFISLFANPFSGADWRVFLPLRLLYVLRYWQPVVFFAITLFALFFLPKEYKRHLILLWLFALGLLICIYATSTLFVFKDIIVHEQKEFALRLLQAFYIVPLPFLILYISSLTNRIYKTITMVILAFFATTSWYFSYPQYNAAFAYYSPSVSKYDVEAVRRIDEMSNGEPYLVLSNQMASAAALQEFGFANYYPMHGNNVLWYPIPTGSSLYEKYIAIVSTGDTEELQNLMRETETQRVYILLQSYWPWYPSLLERLEQSASRMEKIKSKITIFEYLYDEQSK
ncbi:MAG: hypothetical protein AAB886_01800 [Patescibacteria group bacterium]